MYSGGSAPSARDERAVQRLVRPVVVAADHVGDPEVEVVDDARKVVGRVPSSRSSVTPWKRCGQSGRRLAVARLPLALAHRPLVPVDPEPAQVVEDRLLAAGQVARRVGVVDAQQHRVAEVAVGDRAERVADVERAGRARREADAGPASSLGVSTGRCAGGGGVCVSARA